MVISFLLFFLGLAILIKGANWLVDGASSIAMRFKIAPIVIGLTIVAFGTSAPELVVSVTSAMSGNTSIALGNIVGSNVVNILLILGISAIVYPLSVGKNTVWKEVPMSFLGAIIMTVLGIQNLLDNHNFSAISLSSDVVIGSLTFSNGLILLAFFIIFLYYTFGIAKVTGNIQPEIKQTTVFRSVILILAGLMSLALGSKIFVDQAVFLAKSLGVSETFIGLTLVAIGTSMPELVTSVVAAWKKKVELAVGNIVGSNIFNIFFILGATSLIRNIPLTGENLADILVLFIATLILFISFFIHKTRSITRFEGIFMVILYIAYVAFLLIRG